MVSQSPRHQNYTPQSRDEKAGYASRAEGGLLHCKGPRIRASQTPHFTEEIAEPQRKQGLAPCQTSSDIKLWLQPSSLNFLFGIIINILLFQMCVCEKIGTEI